MNEEKTIIERIADINAALLILEYRKDDLLDELDSIKNHVSIVKVRGFRQREQINTKKPNAKKRRK